MNKKLKKAFTLAEVLITLSIIGIVAVLTIPTLVQKTADDETSTRVMKAYSILSSATELIIKEKGEPKLWNINSDTLFDAYKQHLRYIKSCGSTTGCWPQENNKYLNGELTGSFDTSEYRKLVLADGMQAGFAFKSNECTANDSLGSDNYCALIIMDVNGEKEPNQFGRDIFQFVLKENGLYPRGCDAKEVDKVCSTSNLGTGCACRVLLRGGVDY